MHAAASGCMYKIYSNYIFGMHNDWASAVSAKGRQSLDATSVQTPNKGASFMVYTFNSLTRPACALHSYVMLCRQHSPLGTKQYNNLYFSTWRRCLYKLLMCCLLLFMSLSSGCRAQNSDMAFSWCERCVGNKHQWSTSQYLILYYNINYAHIHAILCNFVIMEQNAESWQLTVLGTHLIMSQIVRGMWICGWCIIMLMGKLLAIL